MRINFYLLRLHKSGGGSNQNAISLIRALKKLGHDVEVHTMFQHSNSLPPDIRASARAGEGLGFLSLQDMCANAMKEASERCDAHVVYGQAIVWAGGLYKKRGGKKPVVAYLDSHMDAMKESFRSGGVLHRWRHLLWTQFFGLRLVRRVDSLLMCSPYLLERFVEFGFPREKCEVLPDAFEKPEPAPRVGADSVRFLYAGRLSPEKGVDTLIKACALMSQTPRWRLRIVGEGPELERLKDLVQEKKLEQKISFSPWSDKKGLEQVYAAADVLVVPSRVPEPFGRSIVEALQRGIPCVVPEKGGAPWVAGAGGISFKNDDHVSLKDALESLLLHPDKRAHLISAGADRAALFDSAVVARQLVQAIETASAR